MNPIHKMQDEIERQAEVIEELREALSDISAYANSSKFSGQPGDGINPADIIHRVSDWLSRVNAVADNGRAVVDDDREAIVARYVKEQLRELLPQIKKNGGFYRDDQSGPGSSSVYRTHASNVRVDCNNGNSVVVNTDLQDAYGIDKEMALGDALAAEEKKQEVKTTPERFTSKASCENIW